MKKLTTTLFITVMVMSLTAFTPVNGKYEKAMKENIAALYTASTPEAIQEVINKIERIGKAEADQWHPLYYMGHGYILKSMMVQDPQKIDQILDLAEGNVKKGLELKPGESELVTLQGFIHMLRVNVDPATRGPQFSGWAFASFSQALQIDPNNPRAMTMLGRMSYGTAQFMGTDTSEACGIIKKSIEMYDADSPENPLDPVWGKETAVAFKEMCK